MSKSPQPIKPLTMKTSAVIVVLLLLLNVDTGMAQNGNYVETNGVKIFYRSIGQGEPLLLLHGFTVSHVVWMRFVPRLSDDFRLIIPDLRGHGNSTNPDDIFTHETSAVDMFGLMDALGIEQFKAIGHSSGGMTLTHMSLMDPSRITSMILMGSTSIFPEACREIQRSTTYETSDPGMLGFLMTIHPGGERQIRSIFAQFRTMAETEDDMDFSPEDLSGIKAETLIVHGDRDMFFPVDIPVLSFKAIPNSYLWIVPNDGHVPVGLLGGESVWTDPFFAVAKDFLAGKWNNV